MRFAMVAGHGPALIGSEGEAIPLLTQLAPQLAAAEPQQQLVEVIERFDEWRPRLAALAESGPGLAAGTYELLAPVPRPGKLVCARGNYRENSDREPWPIDVFLKSPESVLAPEGTIVLPPAKHRVFQHEAELAVVIGKTARDVPASDALDYVFGYTGFLDISGRGGVGRADGWTYLGKSYDTFGPMGPLIATPDDVGDPHRLAVRFSLNGEPRQDYNTSDMEHGVDELIEFVSAIMTLRPGDVLSCGTNHQQLGPIQDGDVGEMHIERVGAFTVKVHDALRRTWAREIDTELAARVRKPTR